MAQYNAPFFNALTAVFLEYKKLHGEEQALDFMRTVFSKRLGLVYDALGFEKGDPKDFVRVVGENDRLIGLNVEFREGKNKIIYRFYTDPFPLLKGKVDQRKFDDTYMGFKVSYLLGKGWTYKTTKHFWKGDTFTEHIIEKQ